MPDVHVLLYRSIATRTMAAGEMLTLIKHAQAANAERGVTGLLLHGRMEAVPGMPGAFVQWIEGPEAHVRELFGIVEQDDRHQSVEVLADGPAAEVAGADRRRFGRWAMGLETMSTLPASLDGFLRFYEERGLTAIAA